MSQNDSDKNQEKQGIIEELLRMKEEEERRMKEEEEIMRREKEEEERRREKSGNEKVSLETFGYELSHTSEHGSSISSDPTNCPSLESGCYIGVKFQSTYSDDYDDSMGDCELDFD